jgi:UDP:flavonoid glycosyltransferase YjiC (YdhE family)
VLVSQGTVDNIDPGKLMTPALEALSDTPCLVIVATGGHGTDRLRRRWAAPNVVIADWIDFDAIMPRVDLFICNGGSGSLLTSFAHGVPVVVAGTREGKNDNNAHVDYLGLGINLRTEHPRSRSIRRATVTVLSDPRYRRNVSRIRDEIGRYDPLAIIDEQMAALPIGR